MYIRSKFQENPFNRFYAIDGYHLVTGQPAELFAKFQERNLNGLVAKFQKNPFNRFYAMDGYHLVTEQPVE